MRILHCFLWQLKDIEKELSSIKHQGFDSVLIPPVQKSKEDDVHSPWYMTYQPINFKVEGNRFGSRQDLIDLCNKANELGIRIIVDSVINHCASMDDGTPKPHHKVDEYLKNNKHFWKSENKIMNWNDRWEQVNYNMGLPHLNHSVSEVQEIILSFLNELYSLGVKGVRLDASKNIALPEDNGCEFFPRLVNNFKDKDFFVMGEVIFMDRYYIDLYSKYINVLTDSYGSDKNKLITYVASHDSDAEFKITDRLSSEFLTNEYRLLTQSYPLTMWYTRQFDNNTWKSEVIRNANINNRI